MTPYTHSQLLRGAEMTCIRCTQCCKNQVVVFTRSEWDTIAQAQGTDRTTLALRERAVPIPTENPTEYRLVTSPMCPFLVNGLCSVYDVRPQICRDYPFGKALRGEGGFEQKLDKRCPVVAKWMRLIQYEKDGE